MAFFVTGRERERERGGGGVGIAFWEAQTEKIPNLQQGNYLTIIRKK